MLCVVCVCCVCRRPQGLSVHQLHNGCGGLWGLGWKLEDPCFYAQCAPS